MSLDLLQLAIRSSIIYFLYILKILIWNASPEYWLVSTIFFDIIIQSILFYYFRLHRLEIFMSWARDVRWRPIFEDKTGIQCRTRQLREPGKNIAKVIDWPRNLWII